MSNLPGKLFYSDKLIFRLLRHLVLFISMILVFSWIVYKRDGIENGFFPVAKGVFINSLFFFGYAYVTAYILVPNLLSARRYFLFTLLFLLSGILISVMKYIFSDYLFYTAISADFSERLSKLNLAYILVNTKDMTFIVAIFLIVKFTKDNRHIKMRLREMQDHQIRSEIKLIKNQLDPHVVFNNLNNMYSLSLHNYELLGENLSRLKSVLHYYFIDGKAQCVPLILELETIENYISLERLRYGERLDVNYSQQGSPAGKSIIPFVLFSIVENCFEHGCSIDYGDAWIKIWVKIEKDAVIFHASNSKPGNVLDSGMKGMKKSSLSTKSKLEILYPGKYMLRIDNRDDMYSLDLKLKI